MEESQSCGAEWKKSEWKGYTQHGSIDPTLQKAKYRDRKQLVVARGWGGIDYRQTWKNVWGDELYRGLG